MPTTMLRTRLPLGDLKLEMPKSLTLRYFKTQDRGGQLFMNKFMHVRQNFAVLHLLKCLYMYLGCFGGYLYKILILCPNFRIKTQHSVILLVRISQNL